METLLLIMMIIGVPIHLGLVFSLWKENKMVEFILSVLILPVGWAFIGGLGIFLIPILAIIYIGERWETHREQFRTKKEES